MITNFQIGQCRLTIDTLKTKLFYERQPKITELCNCSLITTEDEKIKVVAQLLSNAAVFFKFKGVFVEL